MAARNAIDKRFHVDLPDSAAASSFSATGNHLAIATLAGPVLVFDRQTGTLLRQTTGHARGALAVAHHPVKDLFASAGQDGSIQWIDGENIWFVRNPTPQSPISHLAWSVDAAVLGAAAGRQLLFYDSDRALQKEIPAFTSTILSFSYSAPIDGFLAACYGGVHIIDRSSLQQRRHLFARTSILTAATSHCGRFVAAGAQEPLVRIWDLHTDDDCVHLEGYRGKVGVLAWGREQSVLATASGSSVVLWSFASGDPHATPHIELSPHPARVLALAFSHDGKTLWTGCADGFVRLFDLTASLDAVFSLDVGAPVHALEMAPHSDALAVATIRGTMSLFDISPVTKPERQRRTNKPKTARRVSP